MVVADVEREGGPVRVGEREPSTRPHHPSHLGNRDQWLSDPLQCALGSCRIEVAIGFSEGAGVPDTEPHMAEGSRCVRSSDSQHLGGQIDPDEFARISQILGKLERSFAETTADVEESITRRQAQMLTFPCSYPASGGPPRGGLHGVEEHGGMRVFVDPLVAESM